MPAPMSTPATTWSANCLPAWGCGERLPRHSMGGQIFESTAPKNESAVRGLTNRFIIARQMESPGNVKRSPVLLPRHSMGGQIFESTAPKNESAVRGLTNRFIIARQMESPAKVERSPVLLRGPAPCPDGNISLGRIPYRIAQFAAGSWCLSPRHRAGPEVTVARNIDGNA